MRFFLSSTGTHVLLILYQTHFSTTKEPQFIGDSSLLNRLAKWKNVS